MMSATGRLAKLAGAEVGGDALRRRRRRRRDSGRGRAGRSPARCRRPPRRARGASAGSITHIAWTGRSGAAPTRSTSRPFVAHTTAHGRRRGVGDARQGGVGLLCTSWRGRRRRRRASRPPPASTTHGTSSTALAVGIAEQQPVAADGLAMGAASDEHDVEPRLVQAPADRPADRPPPRRRRSALSVLGDHGGADDAGVVAERGDDDLARAVQQVAGTCRPSSTRRRRGRSGRGSRYVSSARGTRRGSLGDCFHDRSASMRARSDARSRRPCRASWMCPSSVFGTSTPSVRTARYRSRCRG